MGRKERRNVSRIKLENLPRRSQEDVKTGPFGKVGFAYLGPGEGLLFVIGPYRFVLPGIPSPQDGVLSQ